MRARAALGAAIAGITLLAGCRRAVEDPDTDVPTTSAVDAPWLVGETGTVEETAPGSGIFLIEPGDWHARLPPALRQHGLRVVFSGRPQQRRPGSRMIGNPFMLTGIRRERSMLDATTDALRARFSPGDGPLDR